VYSVLCDLGLGHLKEQDVLDAPLVGGLKGHEVVSLSNRGAVSDLGPEAGQFPWFDTVEGVVKAAMRNPRQSRSKALATVVSREEKRICHHLESLGEDAIAETVGVDVEQGVLNRQPGIRGNQEVVECTESWH
jgi:hypothetical protein